MPKVRYPVLVREQKAAVMRVRYVNLNSTPYAVYVLEDKVVTLTVGVTDVLLSRVVVEGFETTDTKFMLSGEVTAASLVATVVDFFPNSDEEKFVLSGSITSASLYGNVVDWEYINIPSNLDDLTLSGSITSASLFGNVIDVDQTEPDVDDFKLSGSIVGASLA
jgi:hypothetical protein